MTRRMMWLLVPMLSLLATGAGATSIPALQLSVQAGEAAPVFWSPAGQATDDPNQFLFSNLTGKTQDGWTLTWNMTVDADPFITSNFTVLNSTLSTQTYAVVVTLPVVPVTPSSLMGGSVQGGITSDGTAGTLSSAAPTAIYTALIDGSPVATLFNDPTSVSSVAFDSGSLGSVAFGAPIPSAAGPAALSSIGIQLKFTLTPGDQASFTSVFVVNPVPEPATLAMLSGGLVGLAAFGRRYPRS